MTDDPTTAGPLGEAGARLRALVATWRAEADAEDARLKQYCYGGQLDGDMLDEDLSRGFTVNARMKQCAAELEALLSAPVVSPPRTLYETTTPENRAIVDRVMQRLKEAQSQEKK